MPVRNKERHRTGRIGWLRAAVLDMGGRNTSGCATPQSIFDSILPAACPPSSDSATQSRCVD